MVSLYQKSIIVSCITLIGCVEAPLETTSMEQPVNRHLVSEVRSLVDQQGLTPTPPPPVVSNALFELGQALAFDKELSGNRNISCMTCHHPSVGTDDDRHLPRGEGGTGLGRDRTGGPIIPRNAPALFNLHTFDTMFWDSRVQPDGAGGFDTPAGAQLTPAMSATLEFGVVAAQALFPVTSREEMRGQPGDNELADIADSDFQGIWAALMARLGAIPAYVTMFEAAYPGTSFGDMTFAHAANAIGAFEIRAFAALDSPWERFVAGDDRALRNRALRGARSFLGSGCVSCHTGSQFSDFAHHNTGLAQFGPGKGDGPTGTDDFGREQVTGDAADRYGFRTPPLVNIALTGPYGHDGQFSSLKRFVDHYRDPADSLLDYDIEKNVVEDELHDLQLDNSADVIARLDPLAEVAIHRADVNRIVAFLGALTADSSLDLDDTVPATVPSGLPVAD